MPISRWLSRAYTLALTFFLIYIIENKPFIWSACAISFVLATWIAAALYYVYLRANNKKKKVP